jgi:hypothetical protein
MRSYTQCLQKDVSILLTAKVLSTKHNPVTSLLIQARVTDAKGNLSNNYGQVTLLRSISLVFPHQAPLGVLSIKTKTDICLNVLLSNMSSKHSDDIAVEANREDKKTSEERQLDTASDPGDQLPEERPQNSSVSDPFP